MKNEIMKFNTPELQVIEQSKADKIKATFEPMAKMLSEFEDAYNDIINDSEKCITKEVTVNAKKLRLSIGRVRIETGKLKDKQKEYIKLEDKAIMGVHNVLVWAVKEKEDKLKEIESYFEIQEKKRIELLQAERAELLSEYIDDANERDLVKFADDEFAALLSMKKKEKEDRIAAEKKVEEDRAAKEIAEKRERDRIVKENAILKLEAEERDKKARLEKAKQEAETKAREVKEASERKLREEKEAEAKAIYEANIKKERDERIRVENEELAKRKKLEDEIKAKQEAETKAREEENKRIQSELNKGDADKVIDLVNDLTKLKSKYKFDSDKNKAMYNGVSNLLDKVILFINK